MLTALLYFYNVDEDCFTFENNIMLDFGLQDILYIKGLPIDGKQVYLLFYFIHFVGLFIYFTTTKIGNNSAF
jgi:hypothetical protein